MFGEVPDGARQNAEGARPQLVRTPATGVGGMVSPVRLMPRRAGPPLEVAVPALGFRRMVR